MRTKKISKLEVTPFDCQLTNVGLKRAKVDVKNIDYSHGKRLNLWNRIQKGIK